MVDDEVENIWSSTHAKKLCLARYSNVQKLCLARYSNVQKLSNKQSDKVICRLDILRTTHSKKQTSYMSLKTYQPPMHLIT